MVRVSCPNGPGEGEKLPRRVRFSPYRPVQRTVSSAATLRPEGDRVWTEVQTDCTLCKQLLKLIRRGGTRHRLSRARSYRPELK